MTEVKSFDLANAAIWHHPGQVPHVVAYASYIAGEVRESVKQRYAFSLKFTESPTENLGGFEAGSVYKKLEIETLSGHENSGATRVYTPLNSDGSATNRRHVEANSHSNFREAVISPRDRADYDYERYIVSYDIEGAKISNISICDTGKPSSPAIKIEDFEKAPDILKKFISDVATRVSTAAAIEMREGVHEQLKLAVDTLANLDPSAAKIVALAEIQAPEATNFVSKLGRG
jgi:hypothetical protein